MERSRRLQFRGRLLREADSAVGGGRAANRIATTRRFGTVLENVVARPGHSRVPDFDDATLTENTRGAYPLRSSRGTCRAACGPSAGRRDADGRRVRRAAADRAADVPQAHVPFPVGLYGAGRRHRARRDEPSATFSAVLRRAVPARSARRLRALPRTAPGTRTGEGVAGEHRVDGRPARHGPAHADRHTRAR